MNIAFPSSWALSTLSTLLVVGAVACSSSPTASCADAAVEAEQAQDGASTGMVGDNGAVDASDASDAVASATSPDDRHVDPAGDDSNPGTLSQPFRTVQRCASVVKAGMTCLLHAGTYKETVSVATSGTATAPITFAPYNGANVTVSGADPVADNWSIYKGSIYIAPATLPIASYQDDGFLANQVFVGGVAMVEARWPNTTDLLHPVLASGGATTSGLTTTINDSTMPDLGES